MALKLNTVRTRKGWMSPADPDEVSTTLVFGEDRKENAPY